MLKFFQKALSLSLFILLACLEKAFRSQQRLVKRKREREGDFVKTLLHKSCVRIYIIKAKRSACQLLQVIEE
jgi:hypothetical protein